MLRLSIGFSLFAVCVSIGSFVAVQLRSDTWELLALNRFGYVLVGLAIGVACLVGRRESAGAWLAQVAAAVVAIAFVVVGLIKLYTYTSSGISTFQAFNWIEESAAIALAAVAFGLAGPGLRASAAKFAFGAAGLAAVATACYAVSLEMDNRGLAWFGVAATMAFLAASAAAGMRTPDSANP